MNQIAKMFGHKRPLAHETVPGFSSTRCVGIELEVENCGRNQIEKVTASGRWNYHVDHSLRDGIEFVSQPVYGRELKLSLDDAFSSITARNVTWRCGLHVHVDVRDKTAQELHSICSLYAVLEQAMFALEGNNRDESRFCVPWRNQPDMVAGIARTLLSDAPANVTRDVERMGKYSALNLIPVVTQGSVEFRHALMNADKEWVKKWVLLCQAIVDGAGTTTSEDILMRISRHGPIEAVRGLIGDVFPELFALRGFGDMIWNGVDLANLLEVKVAGQEKQHDHGDQCDIGAIMKRLKG